MRKSLFHRAVLGGITAAVLTAASVAPPANATQIDVTWSGTVIDGNDARNLFGVPGSGTSHDLAGFSFSAAYRFDTTLGSTVTGADFADLRGGTQFGAGTDASPEVSATLTINGMTVAFESDQFGGYSRRSSPGLSDIYTEVNDGFGAVDILFFRVFRFDDTIPFGGLTESLTRILGQPGDTVQGYFQQFNDDDTLFSAANLLPTLVTIAPVVDEPPPIDTPEPATLALLGVGALGLVLRRRRP